MADQNQNIQLPDFYIKGSLPQGKVVIYPKNLESGKFIVQNVGTNILSYNDPYYNNIQMLILGPKTKIVITGDNLNESHENISDELMTVYRNTTKVSNYTISTLGCAKVKEGFMVGGFDIWTFILLILVIILIIFVFTR